MSELSRLAFGDEYTDKYEIFKKGLEEIDKKYSDYFRGKKSPTDPNKEDAIKYHYLTDTHGGRINLIFRPDSDLRNDIKEEVIRLFHSAFSKSK